MSNQQYLKNVCINTSTVKSVKTFPQHAPKQCFGDFFRKSVSEISPWFCCIKIIPCTIYCSIHLLYHPNCTKNCRNEFTLAVECTKAKFHFLSKFMYSLFIFNIYLLLLVFSLGMLILLCSIQKVYIFLDFAVMLQIFVQLLCPSKFYNQMFCNDSFMCWI